MRLVHTIFIDIRNCPNLPGSQKVNKVAEIKWGCQITILWAPLIRHWILCPCSAAFKNPKKIPETNWDCKFKFCKALYSTLEIVSLYRSSQKLNGIPAINWGCERTASNQCLSKVILRFHLKRWILQPRSNVTAVLERVFFCVRTPNS